MPKDTNSCNQSCSYLPVCLRAQETVLLSACLSERAANCMREMSVCSSQNIAFEKNIMLHVCVSMHVCMCL